MSNVVNQLRQIQADAHALVVKFHNYHWNVKGLQFHAIHKYTEEAYDMMFEIFDDVAERILQLEQKPLICLKELESTKKVEMTSQDSFTAKEVVENMQKDYTYMLDMFRKLSELADEANDIATGNMADDCIGTFEKSLWMLRQTLA